MLNWSIFAILAGLLQSSPLHNQPSQTFELLHVSVFFCIWCDAKSSGQWLLGSPLSTVVRQFAPRAWCPLQCLLAKAVGVLSPGVGRSEECAQEFTPQSHIHSGLNQQDQISSVFLARKGQCTDGHCCAGRVKTKHVAGQQLKQDSSRCQTFLCAEGKVTLVHYLSGGFSLLCLCKKWRFYSVFWSGLLLCLEFANIHHLTSLVCWLCLNQKLTILVKAFLIYL